MRTLLLVDADRLLRWSLETHLRRWFEVDSTSSLCEALAALEKGRFDVLVHDAGPDPADRELESSARNRNREVRIVRLTTGDRLVAAEPNVVCLEKPFRLESLASLLGVSDARVERQGHVR